MIKSSALCDEALLDRFQSLVFHCRALAGVLTAMDGLPGGVDGGLTIRFHDPIETLSRIGDVAVMRDSMS